MNDSAIVKELVHALRMCLPLVRKDALVTHSNVYAFALRALVDAEARIAEEDRVKRIIEAEKANAEYQRNRPVIRPPSENSLRTARAHGYEHKVLADFAKRIAGISGAEAKNQAARAVRPMPPSPVGGYAPATPPAKGCNCEVCMKYRSPYRFINLD